MKKIKEEIKKGEENWAKERKEMWGRLEMLGERLEKVERGGEGRNGSNWRKGLVGWREERGVERK